MQAHEAYLFLIHILLEALQSTQSRCQDMESITPCLDYTEPEAPAVPYNPSFQEIKAKEQLSHRTTCGQKLKPLLLGDPWVGFKA